MAPSRPDPEPVPDLSADDAPVNRDGGADPGLTRREVLGLGAAVVASTAVGSTVQAAVTSAVRPQPVLAAPTAEADELRPPMRPRADWAGELGVTGELVPEDDVRFLLVHHTASTNDYGPEDVVGQIRGFYDFHTGPEKGWPDVAYNFFVDRYGVIWEGRQGSIAGPVRGDATGGSQGFALLCSLIGNHIEAPVTAEAQQALVKLLAWLGATYEVDTSPGATVTFVSRGSNRWAAGTEVTARTISGHREMSRTSCPGDFAFDLLDRTVPDAVTAVRAQSPDSTPPTSTTAAPDDTSSTGADPGAGASGADVGQGGDGSSSARSSTTVEPATADGGTTGGGPASIATGGPEGAEAAAGDLGSDGTSWPLVVAGGILAAAAAGVGAVSRLFERRPSAGPGDRSGR